MRSLVLIAFLAAAFTAAVAAPSVQQPHGHALSLRSPTHVKAIDEDLLLDLISLILGVDARAIIAQAEATITGLDALLQASSAELVNILEQGGADVVAQAQAIIAGAVAEAEEIVQPIVRIIEAIVNLISRRDLIGDLLEALLNRLVSLVETTIQKLEDLAIRTVTALSDLANSAGQDIANQVTLLLVRTVGEGIALVQPLLELLEPILPGSGRLDLIDLIELITGIPIRAIAAQAQATAEGLAALVPATLSELQGALAGAAEDLVAQVQALLTQSLGDASELITPILNILEKLQNGGNQLILIPALILAVNQAVAQLPGIVEGAVQAIVSLAQAAGAAAAADVAAILADAAAQAEALIQPLLDLLAPIIGGGSKIKLIA